METLALPTRYAVRYLLGEGGAGRVYRVFDLAREREVALKVVPTSGVDFLRREFDTLRQVRHENLIQVFDWGTLETGDAYYTMELVEGRSWHADAGIPQPAAVVRTILVGVLRGLAHLHCHGEIHGDLKPANILLGHGGVVKVSDVGMGGSGSRTASGGTPGYSAPECWQWQTADVRSDLYSVGVMAYEALTGKHPFAGRTIRSVVAGQLEGWVPSPGAHGVRVPQDIERVVMRALERDPHLRQGSADEFMAGLGVEDRVGAILGGKFVDPGDLLPGIIRRVHRDHPDDPTLVHISGAPGVGKTEFMEQLSVAYIGSGVRCIRVFSGGSMSFSQAVIIGLGAAGDGPMRPNKPAELADLVRAQAERQPLAILFDVVEDGLRSDVAEAKTLAQHLFAGSLETGEPPDAVVVVAENYEAQPEVYSVNVKIPELDERRTRSLVEGLLGNLDITPGALRALHNATGGNPSSLHAVVFDLMAHADLDRIDGRWKLREVGRLGEGTSPTLEGRWRRRWLGLEEAQQDVLGSIALISSLEVGLVQEHEALFRCSGAVTRLQSSGWLRHMMGQVVFASEGMRDVALTCLDDARKRGLAVRLLDSGRSWSGVLGIALRLLAAPTREVVTEAIEVAAAAIGSRSLPKARALLAECLRYESVVTDPHDRAAIHITLAEVLVEAGDVRAAELHLHHESVAAITLLDPAIRAKVHLLLGTIAGRAGRVVEARSELERAMNEARATTSETIYLRALAAYAELSWTHGNDEERNAAIHLVKKALSEIEKSTTHQDERGQLVYGLGAAYIRTGQLQTAISALLAEFPGVGSPYWSARVANALGTACFYLGRYDEALGYLARGLDVLQDGEAPETRARIHANRGACLNAMGRLREALDENERALVLSRRSGSGYDTVAAAAGIAIDLYYLARFDEAIAKAREVCEIASRIANVVYEFKGLELAGFSALAIGDLDRVGRTLDDVSRLPEDYEPVRTLPRVEMLRARYSMARGDKESAHTALERARDLLKTEPDLEDLWGIEIELAALNQVEAGVDATLAALAAIARKAGESKVLVVEIQAASAIAQILFHQRRASPDLIRMLTTVLGRAEESGFVDEAWKISLGLGAVLFDAGDVRAGHTRLVQTQRLLVHIANGLSEDSRRIFVRAPHVAPALEEIAKRISPVSEN